MPAILAAILTAGRFALLWLGRIGIGVVAIDLVANLTNSQKATITEATSQAKAGGMTDDDFGKIAAATTYDQVEQNGKDPDDFWSGLSPKEKELLQFSPESLRQDMGRTKFLGLTSAFLFVAALAAGGVGALKGIPILLSTLAKMQKARASGASALSLMTIAEEGKIAGIAAVWVPGLVAAVAASGGWLSSTMVNNLNDASLWGRIFLGQSAEDFEKQLSEARKLEAKGSSSGATLPARKTIIRMTEEKKPEQFIGTLFSAKLGSMQSFERLVSDEINDENELREDAKLGINRWLATLPGRLGYSVVIRKNPVDEFGTKQSGIWATLTFHITRLNGPITPIDTILLGPVTPTTQLKLTRVTKLIEGELNDVLSAQEVTQIQIPSGAVDIFDKAGERVDLATPAPAPVAAATPAPIPQVASVSGQKIIDIVTAQPPVSVPAALPQQFVPMTIDVGVQTTTPGTLAPPPPPAPAGKFLPNRPAGAKISQLGIFANQVMKVNTPGSCLNIRAGSGLDRPVGSCVAHNTEVVVISFDETRDNFTWVRVFIPTLNTTGNMAFEFLTPA